jgi:CheY-like chemotaxis protein
MEPYTLQVDIARHGKEALQCLQTASTDHPYHLVLMDCQMPEMDGYETTRQIRAGIAGKPYQTVPIIAMTAYAMAGDPEKCLMAGMDDYMSKPLTKGKVIAVLAKWSEKHKRTTPDDAINAQAFQTLLAGITQNNSEVIVQLLQGTQEDVQQLVESIVAMLERGDNSDAQKALYSLQGKSLTIGAFGLREVCQQMELILKAGNTPDARLIETLEVESKKLLQAITIKLQAYN